MVMWRSSTRSILRSDHGGSVVGICQLIWKISEVRQSFVSWVFSFSLVFLHASDGGTYIFWTSTLLDLQIPVLHGVERSLRAHVFFVFVYYGGFQSLHSCKSISGDVCTSVTTSGAP